MKRTLPEADLNDHVELPMASTSRLQDQDSPTKKRIKRQLLQEIAKNKIKSKKLRVQGQKLKRYKKKVLSLKQIINDLKSKNLLALENSLLFANMPEITRELQKRKLGKKVRYSPELRKFAITLCFYSPKAYDYVRKAFDTCLPHRSTIGKWFKNVNIDPGFSEQSFELLKKHVQLNGSTLVSLIIDEMSIRRHIEWDGKKFHGYVNYGIDTDDDQTAVAKEVFVIMAVCVNGKWKLPVGYFFVDGLTGDQKCTLVSHCVKLVTDTGAHVISLTFDGAPSNITMTNLLGCSSEINNVLPFFLNNGKKIVIFYDPCHMIKLVRNCFGEKKIIVDGHGMFIKWEFIEKLEALQNAEGLHLGNKVRKAHLNFFKQKMKVRLAVQLLSESVADALLYCEQELQLKEFEGCHATAHFLKVFNNVFDILNSRSLVAPSFKKALCEKNFGHTIKYINEAIHYISNLKFENNTLIVNSRRKTGFIGLIISLKSSILLYEEIIQKQKLLIYLPLYKTSQDHLELFFSSIRARGGWNNNPTVRQFTAAYKRLLVRAEIREGGMGNCIPLDEIPILVGSSRYETPEQNINCNRFQMMNDTFEVEPLESIINEHDYIMNSKIITECSSQIIIYISGFVVRQLQRSIKCEMCVQALAGDKANFLNSLITRKTHGGLTYPSHDVCKICKTTEHFLRINEHKITTKNFLNYLKSKIMFHLSNFEFFTCLNIHVLECSSNHIYFLTECIVTKYLNIRLHFIGKRKSEIEDPVRNQFTKLILFKGQ